MGHAVARISIRLFLILFAAAGCLLPVRLPESVAAAAAGPPVTTGLHVAAAAGSTARPGKFSTIKVKAKSSTSIGLSWKRPKNAVRFVIVRSTDKDLKLNVARMKTSKTYFVDKKLKRAKPGASYYYRIIAYNKKHTARTRSSPVIEANLEPLVPKGLKILDTANNGATLRWNAAWNARGYTVRIGTNKSLSKGVKTFTTADSRPAMQLNTLKAGRKYYFQVRSINGRKTVVRSGYSKAVAGTTRKSGTPLTVMTFNVLTLNYSDGNPAHEWLSRRPAVVSTITGAGADVVGVQEAYDGYGFPGGDGLTPQWESLRQALVPKGYDRAPTGTDGIYDCRKKPGCRSDEYHLNGNHIFYRKSTVKPVGNGGKIALPVPDRRPSGYQAPWQVFEKLDGSRTRFLAVSTHFYPVGITLRGQFEVDREQQAKALVAGLRDKVNLARLPVVLLGDFNSLQEQEPVTKLIAAGYSDAAGIDVPKVKDTFNSSHKFLDPPKTNGKRIDYVFVSADISVKKWELVARIDSKTGRFVGPVPSDHHAIKAVLTLPK